MKLIRCTFLCFITLAIVLQVFAQDNATRNPDTPPSSNPRRTIQDGPRDLLKETLRQAEKEAAERNYKQMKDAAAELALLSRQLSDEVDKGSEHVISIKIFDRIEKIEKLLKDIRSKATAY
jgi:hypothetical protein